MSAPEHFITMQVITLSHNRYEKAIPSIQSSFLKSQKAQQRLKLQAVGQVSPDPDQGVRYPKTFNTAEAGMPMQLLLWDSKGWLAIECSFDSADCRPS